MKLDEKIKTFIKSLNSNAPLNSCGKTLNGININGYKYPYKPLLILSICNCIEDVNKLFNNKIFINDKSPITKMYYDYLMNSEIMYEYLKTHNSKENWFLVFNNKVAKQVVSNLFEQPIKKLNSNGFWYFDRKEKWIMIKYEGSEQDKINLKNLLIIESYKTLKKCIPDFKDLSQKEFENYNNFWYQQMMVNELNLDEKVKTRKFQHIFRRVIFQRDNRCKICCLETPELLEAAHIKPFSKCTNDNERYSSDNGILLCKNHHKLFDEGYFTFTKDWKVVISNEYKENYEVDNNLLFKTFERCYEKELFNFPNNNEYTEFHNKYIYKN